MKLKLPPLKQTDYLKLGLPVVAAVVYYLFHQNFLAVALYVVGWFAGMGLLIWDKNQLYKYYFESVHLPNDHFARLITRSLLFILAYCVLSVFLITSGGNSLGVGMVAGIGLGLLFELWQSKTYVDFFNHYFIQAKKSWNAAEINRFVQFFIIFYIITSILGVVKF